MARIVGHIAASLDGLIADPQESLDWLFKAEAQLGEHHYDVWMFRKRRFPLSRE